MVSNRFGKLVISAGKKTSRSSMDGDVNQSRRSSDTKAAQLPTPAPQHRWGGSFKSAMSALGRHK
jgi:hypothetical protein